MLQIQRLISDHIKIWTNAEIKKKSGPGRLSGNTTKVYGFEKLRALILDLAIRGKLVSQNPNDEKVSELLERIEIRKIKLNYNKTLPLISEHEIPFDLNQGWKWVRLGTLGITKTGGTPKTSDAHLFEGTIPFIGPGQISAEGKLLKPQKYLTKEGVFQSALCTRGDILMVCIGGSIGKTLLVNEPLAFNQQINVIQPIFTNSSFLNYMMSSKIFQHDLIAKSSGSATPIINRSKWEKLLIPVAPLKEQDRISSTLDRLMAMCNQLEQEHINSKKAHAKLVKVLLDTLTQTKT